MHTGGMPDGASDPEAPAAAVRGLWRVSRPQLTLWALGALDVSTNVIALVLCYVSEHVWLSVASLIAALSSVAAYAAAQWATMPGVASAERADSEGGAGDVRTAAWAGVVAHAAFVPLVVNTYILSADTIETAAFEGTPLSDTERAGCLLAAACSVLSAGAHLYAWRCSQELWDLHTTRHLWQDRYMVLLHSLENVARRGLAVGMLAAAWRWRAAVYVAAEYLVLAVSGMPVAFPDRDSPKGADWWKAMALLPATEQMAVSGARAHFKARASTVRRYVAVRLASDLLSMLVGYDAIERCDNLDKGRTFEWGVTRCAWSEAPLTTGILCCVFGTLLALRVLHRAGALVGYIRGRLIHVRSNPTGRIKWIEIAEVQAEEARQREGNEQQARALAAARREARAREAAGRA